MEPRLNDKPHVDKSSAVPKVVNGSEKNGMLAIRDKAGEKKATIDSAAQTNTSSDQPLISPSPPLPRRYLLLEETKHYENSLAELIKNIRPENARTILIEIKKIPKHLNTYAARLKCLQLDHTIETWEAFTYAPLNELHKIKKENVDTFIAYLVQPRTWIPEVDRLMLTIQQNLWVQLGQTLTPKDEKADEIKRYRQTLFMPWSKAKPLLEKKKCVMIVRGMPAAGKTSALTGTDPLSGDQIKKEILKHYDHLTPQQTHFQASALMMQFRATTISQFKQVPTRDSLFLEKVHVENDMKEAGEKGQRVRIVDIDVPFEVACIRMLKRNSYHPRMDINTLKESFKKTRLHRLAVLSLMDTYKDIIDDYQLQSWQKNQFVVVAQLVEIDPSKKAIIINDEKEYEKITSPVSESLLKELDDFGNTVITSQFIIETIAKLSIEQAQELEIALRKYEGKTFSNALHLHAMEPITTLSSAARVVQEAHAIRLTSH